MGGRRFTFVALTALSFCACADPPVPRPNATSTAATSTTASRAGALPPERRDTRYVKIRNLLLLDHEDHERVLRLPALVAPICTDADARKEFLDVAAWSASFASERDNLPAEYAADVIEHVATHCFRTEPEKTLEMLEDAARAVPRTTRFDIVAARLFASWGRLEDAEKAADRARARGSVHAIALVANIRARRARAVAPGHRAGMLDDAIEVVSEEPTKDWQLIDLAAVLSTRARLLGERAVWGTRDRQRADREAAAAAHRRLTVAPFIHAFRERSLDVLCFDAMDLGNVSDEACRSATEESPNLGATAGARVPMVPPRFDVERLERIRKLDAELAQVDRGATALLVARGDEAEILEWAFAAARFLRHLRARGVDLVLVDRTTDERATALVGRILELAHVEPRERILARKDPFATPCVVAVLAKRRAPTACPLEPSRIERLRQRPPIAVGVLIGRDLDAEIADLELYDVPTALLSFRLAETKKKRVAAFESLSDVFLIARANE